MADSGKRLLFIVEHFRRAASGAENDAVALCRALAAAGDEVHVVARTADAFTGIATHADWDDPAAVARRVTPDLTIDWGLFAPADVHRLGGGVHADYIRCSVDGYRGLARLWRRWRYRSAKHRRIIAAETALLQRPQAYVAAISDMVAAQARRLGVPDERVRVLYNAVDLSRFAPAALAARREAQRRIWGVHDEEVVCLFIAHNLRLKNLHLLRQVFARVAPAWPGLRLVVVGKRDPGFRAPWLIYAGATNQIEDFYAAGDALLHPSFYDSFGNVVLEAMAAGLPVIISDRTGAGELLTPERDGLILPVTGSGGADVWRDALEKLAGDSIWRMRLGAAARRTAVQHPFDDYVQQFRRYLDTVHAGKTAIA